MAPNVLIAASEHLPALKERADLGETLAFSDSEALRALDVITRQRPDIVVFERQFAATARGTALINRIKADPSLGSCEIRIIPHDGEYEPASAVVMAAAAPVADPPQPIMLDKTGTRRAPRIKMAEGTEILIDGNPAALLVLSTTGAQVLSPTILRPNQRLRLSIPDAKKPIRITGGVVWAAFEMPKGGPCYRAGIEFFDADSTAIDDFCARRKAPGDGRP